ncbi:hypothetical protein [uncultured Thiodictyon sp.]|uniref:hypothetical protein n=1 Tax=uncultured Thiodictyon sp. TaxID=1846217 RepID=UPI0025F9D5E8|nr:hypothetical protein [uncultured Thiodictyon sp.]
MLKAQYEREAVILQAKGKRADMESAQRAQAERRERKRICIIRDVAVMSLLVCIWVTGLILRYSLGNREFDYSRGVVMVTKFSDGWVLMSLAASVALVTYGATFLIKNRYDKSFGTLLGEVSDFSVGTVIIIFLAFLLVGWGIEISSSIARDLFQVYR